VREVGALKVADLRSHPPLHRPPAHLVLQQLIGVDVILDNPPHFAEIYVEETVIDSYGNTINDRRRRR
jgi:hypothetical protein